MKPAARTPVRAGSSLLQTRLRRGCHRPTLVCRRPTLVCRRRLAGLLLAACCFDSFGTNALAQAVPGGALGSQTGDAAATFTGLASAPETNLFTGAAQTSIPIVVPPGRLGLAPVLALAYSSSVGASPYGHGWSLPLARIRRSTRNGVPHYDERDEFVLEMPGAIAELERIPGSARGFRAKIESAFLRIGYDETAKSWTVIDKLGVRFVFGTTPSARTGRGEGNNAAFAWLIERIEDPAGNRIDFTYLAGGPGEVSVGLPSTIQYGANARVGLPHFAQVTFAWAPLGRVGPARTSFREGYADVLDLRLAAIETSTHGLAARRYVLNHEEDAVSADLRLAGATLTAFGETESETVELPSTVFVYAPSVHDGWPAIGSTAQGATPYEIVNVGYLRLGNNVVTADTLDINGDSLPDRIDTSPRPPTVRLGNGQGFDVARTWNWPAGLSAPRVVRRSDHNGNLQSNVFDLDGDSFSDLVDSDPAACTGVAGQWCVWFGSSTGFATQAQRWAAPLPFLRTTESGGARVLGDLIDMNADGRLDVLDASVHDSAAGQNYWHLYRNTGTGFETVPVRLPTTVSSLSRRNGQRLLHALVDLNGDSLPDLVFADPGSPASTVVWNALSTWEVYLNNGQGFAAAPVSWPLDGGANTHAGLPNFMNFQASDGSTTADLFDLTGDGRPDLVRRTGVLDTGTPESGDICRYDARCLTPDDDGSAVSHGACCFFLQVFVNTGSSFSQPVPWSAPAHGLRASNTSCPGGGTSGCTTSTVYDFDFFDVDGDGLADFVQRNTAYGKPGDWLVHPHPASPATGGGRPNLLLAMRNGTGGETMLRYTTAAQTPETRLPFAQWMVAERELRDAIFDQAPLHSWFNYRGGYFDPAEREARGFAVVQQSDPAGVVTASEYHQDRRRSGRLHRQSTLTPPDCSHAVTNPDGSCQQPLEVLGVADYAWSDTGPVLLERESDVPFHLGAPVENLRRTTDYRHDAYGNVVWRRTITPLAATTSTSTSFAYRITDGPGGMPSDYLVAKPLRARTEETGRESPLLERSYDYEWKQPAPATLSASSTCLTWNSDVCAHWSRQAFEYDTSGNMVSAQSPDGARSRTEYDQERLFAVRAVDSLGMVTSSTTDPRTGMVTETITPNGTRLRSRYDGLGRLLRTWGPGTSKTAPLRRVQYAPGGLSNGPPRMISTTAGAGSAATFFDGLGRLVATKRESDDQGVAVSIVSGLKIYDARGLVRSESLPFASASLDVGVLSERFADAPAWLEFDYDQAGRLVETRAPSGSVTRADRSSPGILRTEDANFTSGLHPGAISLDFFDGLGRRLQRDVCSAAPSPSKPYDCPPSSLLRRESWIWDGLGRVAQSRTDALGKAAADSVTRHDYDGLGNRSRTIDSNAGAWTFRHDNVGRAIEVLKPDSTQLQTSYDTGGRLRRQRAPSGSAIYRYHLSGGGIGKLKRMITRTREARSSEDFEYDDRGRVMQRRRRISVRGRTPAELSVAYRYDELDRRIATEFLNWDFDGPAIVRSTYDDFGREISVDSESSALVSSASWDWSGRLRRVDFANGTTNLTEYDEHDNASQSLGQLRCRRTLPSASASGTACDTGYDDLDGLHYGRHDANGNLVQTIDPLRGADDPLFDTRRYEYDALGRLTAAAVGAGPTASFAFDPLGNLLRQSDRTFAYQDSVHPSRLTSTVDANGAVWLVEHDANGRRVRRGDQQWKYDDYDRLTQVLDGEEVLSRIGYLATGERVYQTDSDNGDIEFFLGDGVRVQGDRIERTILFAGQPVVVESHSVRPRSRNTSSGLTERNYLHSDHQGSVRLVTNEVGVAQEHHRYAPFGERLISVNGSGRPQNGSVVPYSFTGQRDAGAGGLLYFGARHYDPSTGSFLTLDPAGQFPSPYAYSGGNPISGRDADGSIFQLTALEFLVVATATAVFVDSIVSSGDLGHSLTAGVYAGFSVYFSSQLSTAMVKPVVGVAHPWLQMTASVASNGFRAIDAAEAIADGRYAGGIVAAGMLASSLIGIESSNDPGLGSTQAENFERHGIWSKGAQGGQTEIKVGGICSTRPGCLTNVLVAAQENLRTLFGQNAACVGGCEYLKTLIRDGLKDGDVLLHCNSYGSIKCLAAIQGAEFAGPLSTPRGASAPSLSVEMSGSPLLRPPAFANLTYQVNLFDPVVWMGTAYSTPFRSDVVLGRNWWVPTPILVHHASMYEKPFQEALGDILP